MAGPADWEMARALQIRSLSLATIVSGFNPSVPARLASAVSGGSLRVEPPGGAQYTLGPGDRLRFGASAGEFRSLRLGKDGIALRFAGRVSRMTLGQEESGRTLMPSVFEWLREEHPLSLAAAASLYATAGIWLWLRSRRRSKWIA